MATTFLVLTFQRQILQAMVDESPNKHFSLVPAQIEIGQNRNFASTWWPRFESQKLKMVDGT
jgi:hypothetical protein